MLEVLFYKQACFASVINETILSVMWAWAGESLPFLSVFSSPQSVFRLSGEGVSGFKDLNRKLGVTLEVRRQIVESRLTREGS